MRKSRLKKSVQRKLSEHFVAGTTARCAAELVGVNRKTAAYFFLRLREIIAYEMEQEACEVFCGESRLMRVISVAGGRASAGAVLVVKFLYLGF